MMPNTLVAIRRACLWLGALATVSLLLALAVMLFLYETPQTARWFLASAALAGVSYLTALLAARWEP